MYIMRVYYQKRSKIRILQKNIDTNLYDDAISIFDQYIDKKRIRFENIILFSFFKVIRCDHCQKTLTLTGFTNQCACGAVYNTYGDEIEQKQKILVQSANL